MVTTHDDMPHPVPPIAYLRYKENWFFLIMDQKNSIFGAIHVVSEPGFDRIRFASHLMVQGESFNYSNVIPFPANFEMSTELSDGKFGVRFVKAHEQIDLSLHDDNVDLDISFFNRAPMFDYQDYDHANPGKVTVQEIANFASNQQYVHKQQGMYTRGTLAMKKGKAKGQTFHMDALGYRDHSRSVRCDNMTTSKHVWSGLLFPQHVFGAMSVSGTKQPEPTATCGYAYDESAGLRSLRQVDIVNHGNGPDGVPETIEFSVTDLYNRPYTVVADLTNRFAHVPLHVEMPGATPFMYTIVENFCPLLLKETGEKGIGIVEVGWIGPVEK